MNISQDACSPGSSLGLAGGALAICYDPRDSIVDSIRQLIYNRPVRWRSIAPG
jgi:hypothetical protein